HQPCRNNWKRKTALRYPFLRRWGPTLIHDSPGGTPSRTRRLQLVERHSMLTFFNQHRAGRMCDGLSRREFLRVGALGVGGLTLADLLRLRAQGKPPVRSKSVIMVYLEGGPSHIDMYDLKPNAPAGFRGEFQPIQTNVPGFDICEHMPLQARIADKMA